MAVNAVKSLFLPNREPVVGPEAQGVRKATFLADRTECINGAQYPAIWSFPSPNINFTVLIDFCLNQREIPHTKSIIPDPNQFLILTSSESTMSRTTAIIGGGACDLTLARLLQCNGIDYTLYERDVALQGKGQDGTLDLHFKTGQEALREAGLFSDFDELARWDASSIAFADGLSGETFLGFGHGHDAVELGKGSEHSRPEIDRRQLRQLLLSSLPAEKVRWSSSVVSLDKNSWPINFADGSMTSGIDLIVGADGAWSRVRPALTTAKPFYSGKHFIEARISKDNKRYVAAREMVGRGNFAALGGGQWFSIQQMADESYRVYIGIQVPEGYTQKVDLEQNEVVRRNYLTSPQFYQDWSRRFKDIIEQCEGPFRAWPLYSFPAEAVDWPPIRSVTLVGDAAHVTVPDGEGVNRAMYDALVLVKNIVKYRAKEGGMEKAVAEYESEMFSRVRKGIAEALSGLDIVFADNAVELTENWTAEMARHAQKNLE